jgi:hypothetical protein
MLWALNNAPRRLTPEQRHALSWDAAMERYADSVHCFLPR